MRASDRTRLRRLHHLRYDVRWSCTPRRGNLDPVPWEGITATAAPRPRVGSSGSPRLDKYGDGDWS